MAFGHRRLRVYCIALGIAARVFRGTRTAPPYAWPVTRQLVRAITSVVLNIAEGAGEFTPREKARFYRMARRSAAETTAAIDLLIAMKVIPDSVARETDADLDEMAAILTTMIRNQDIRAETREPKQDATRDPIKKRRIQRTNEPKEP